MNMQSQPAAPAAPPTHPPLRLYAHGPGGSVHVDTLDCGYEAAVRSVLEEWFEGVDDPDFRETWWSLNGEDGLPAGVLMAESCDPQKLCATVCEIKLTRAKPEVRRWSVRYRLDAAGRYEGVDVEETP